MKKISFLFLLMVLFSVLSCRNEGFYSEKTSQQNREFSYRIVDKKDIPGIINFVSVKTDNFKVPLKQTTALNKTETDFGEVNTDYIIEAINEKNETYYVFSIIPSVESGSDVYNLEVRSEGDAPQTAKIMVYLPSEDWVLNGNGNYSVFSGKVKVYSEDGDLESSTSYLNGAGDCNDDPCPDCPPGPANPPGNPGNGNGGIPPGGNPPPGTGGTGMPTGCYGCYSTTNPPTTPPSNPPTTPGSSSPGWWDFHCENDLSGQLWCGWYWVEYNNVPRLANPCSGSGMVNQAPQKTPCEKAKTPTLNANNIMKNPNVTPKLAALSIYAANSTVEYGLTVSENNGAYSATDPFTDNNPGSVTIPAPTNGNYAANAHSHPNGGATPPSVSDFYACLHNAVNYNNFQAGFVFSYDGSVFAFVVTDRQQAAAFLNKYPKDTNWDSEKKIFNKDNQIGKDFNKVYKDFTEGRAPSYSGSGQNDALETSLAYVLEKYNTGISIAKTDASGNLKPLKAVPFEYTIPASGGKKITAYKTEMCP